MSFGLAFLVVTGIMLAGALYLGISFGLAVMAGERFDDIGFVVTMFIMIFLPIALIQAWAISSGA